MFSYNEKDYFEWYNYFDSKSENELIALRNLKNAARNRMKNFMLLGGLITFCLEQLFITTGSLEQYKFSLFIAAIIIVISFVSIIKHLERLELESLVIDHVLENRKL